MSDPYAGWSKARLAAELRARSMDDEGSTRALRERLTKTDRAGDGGAAREAEAAPAEAGAAGADGDRHGAGAVGADGDRRGAGAPRADGAAEEDGGRQRDGAPRGAATPNGDAPDAVAAGEALVLRMRDQLRAITGKELDAIVGIRVHERRFSVEVVDLPQIPPSTEIVDTYEVVLDRTGAIESCRRTGRQRRGLPARRAHDPL
jgi:hypothetical protein